MPNRQSRTTGKVNRPLLQSRPMTDMRSVLKTLERDQLFKIILALAIYALVPLAEIFLFIYLGDLIGNYLVLVMAAVAGIAGMLVVIGQLRGARERLKARIAQGKYPGRQYVELAGIIVAAVLLITPGFITDCAGYLLLIPAVRRATGRLVVKKLQRSFREIYDQLRLSAL
jgi:UPF0716 protein FxsA